MLMLRSYCSKMLELAFSMFKQ